jgi:hypothetical protein
MQLTAEELREAQTGSMTGGAGAQAGRDVKPGPP